MSVSRETLLDDYVALLQRWGAALNLTSARQNSATALRSLVDDCLCLLPHLPNGLARMIDLGSGQGFPAIPLAIVTGVAVELVEADRRKAAFLTTAMAQLGLHGRVHTSRIEATKLDSACCVTARALAPMPQLATLAKPFISPGGFGLFLKGQSVAAELAALAGNTQFETVLLPTSRPPSTLVKLTVIG